MEKATYNIAYMGGRGIERRKIDGYVFWFSGLRFGVSNMTTSLLGKDYKSTVWTVTELTTGCAVIRGKRTRKDAINALVLDRVVSVEAIKAGIEYHEKMHREDINEGLKPGEEIYTVRPQHIVKEA